MIADAPRITALVYADSLLADQALRRIVRQFEAAGRRLAGMVQPGSAGTGRPLNDADDAASRHRKRLVHRPPWPRAYPLAGTR